MLGKEIFTIIILIVVFVSGCMQPSQNLPPLQQQQQITTQTTLSPQPKNVQTPPSCCNHPYYHSIWKATSKDGKTWTKENKLLIDHASVPHPIQLANDSIVVYYVNGSVDTFDCSITDDGINYRYGDCKLYNYTTQKAWDPYVIKLSNGKYKLFFFGPEQPVAGMLPTTTGNKIYSALSEDGINFYQEDSVRFQESEITDPAVILVNNVWKMYTAKGSNVVVAQSSDGYTFSKVGEYDTKGSVPDILRLYDGSLLLFVCNNGISYMIPPEISGNTNILGNAIAVEMRSIICDPGIVKLNDGTYVMYYKKQTMS